MQQPKKLPTAVVAVTVETTKASQTLDSLFVTYIGTCGKFQKRLIWYITLIVGPLIGFNITTQLLILLIPPHLCDSGDIFARGLTNVNTSLLIAANQSTGSASSANHSSRPCDQDQLVVRIDEMRLNTSFNFRCPFDKRKFDHSVIYPTLVSENDWVCDNKWKALLPHVVFRAGSVLGILCIGIFSDRYGRIPTTIGCFTIAGFAGIATIFSSSSFVGFLICRAVVGFVSFKGTIPMIHVTEFVGPLERTYVASGLQLSIGITNITLPWIAYFIRDWRILAAFTSGAMFLVPLISCFIPESVRWLMSRCEEEQTERAKAIMRQMSRINGTQIPEEALQDMTMDTGVARESLWTIFKYKRFIGLFAMTTLIWIIIAMVSWGGNLYVAILTDHPFVMISINSALDVIATFCSQGFANCFGRRKTVVVSGLFVFVIYLATAFVPVDEKYLFLTLLFIGRLGVTIVYNVKYLYAAELFPTAIRSRAMALRLSFGCVGGLLSPYILVLDFWGKSSPLVFYGSFSLIAALVMCFLPETMGKALPDTLAEANAFGLKVSESAEEMVKSGQCPPTNARRNNLTAVECNNNFAQGRFRYVSKHNRC